MHVGSFNIKRKKTSDPEIAGNPAADYDGAWKDGWKQKFHQFLNAYFPHIACQIDWAQPIVWLDKEIEKIISHTGKEKGKRVDLLVRVTLKDGSQRVLLLHIEVQSSRDDDLPARIHRYWSGLYFHTGEQVISLVVLADINANWHPKTSTVQFGRFKSEIQFETCKLLDLDLDNPDLRGIPYEVARAQLAALRTTNNPQARYRAKKDLLLNLYQCGYTADDIREAYGLIDHMMMLSDTLRTQLNQEIKEYEEKFTMPYVTSIEQEGIEKVAVKMILGGKSDQEIAEFTELALNLIQKLRRQLEDSDKPSG
jgi:hypothetical protein